MSWTKILTLGLLCFFFSLFLTLAIVTFENRHFSLDGQKTSLEKHVDLFSQELNASFTPLHHLFDQQGPLGIFSNLVQKRIDQNDAYALVISQVFSDQLSPHHLNTTDREMMSNVNQKVNVILDFAQGQVQSLGTQAYLYLELGQHLVRTIDMMLFYGSLVSFLSLGTAIVLEIKVLYQTRHLRKRKRQIFLLE